jgi:formylglycine-generating enzyme required for sulfatase activity
MTAGAMRRLVICLAMSAVAVALTRCSWNSPTRQAIATPTFTVTPTRRATATPTPMPTLISEKDGMVLLPVPAGPFLMGSVNIEQRAEDRDESQERPFVDAFLHAGDDERPQHTVILDAFWIDQTEVTNAMYASFLNQMGNQVESGATWLDHKALQVLIQQDGEEWKPVAGYANHPVAEVTWYGARAYCEWAGRRLPTEAEWEKAARGKTGQLYPWGNEQPTCELANLDWACYLRVPTEVGSYPAGISPYGALDMGGNVWEWVADWYSEEYYATSPAFNPQGPESGDSKVIRGGSWHPHQYDVRAANRAKNRPTSSGRDVGFRCVLESAPQRSAN